jgi:hypothetical protein
MFVDHLGLLSFSSRMSHHPNPKITPLSRMGAKVKSIVMSFAARYCRTARIVAAMCETLTRVS